MQHVSHMTGSICHAAYDIQQMSCGICLAAYLYNYDFVSDSEQAMNFQITLLLTSFVYLDVITQQIPAVQSVYDTPMILLFFVIVLVMQVVLIVGRLLQI